MSKLTKSSRRPRAGIDPAPEPSPAKPQRWEKQPDRKRPLLHQRLAVSVEHSDADEPYRMAVEVVVLDDGNRSDFPDLDLGGPGWSFNVNGRLEAYCRIVSW